MQSYQEEKVGQWIKLGMAVNKLTMRPLPKKLAKFPIQSLESPN